MNHDQPNKQPNQQPNRQRFSILLIFEIVIAVALGFGLADLNKVILQYRPNDPGPKDMRSASSTLPAELAGLPWPKSSSGRDFWAWGLLHGLVVFGSVHFLSRKLMRRRLEDWERMAVLPLILFALLFALMFFLGGTFRLFELTFVAAMFCQFTYFTARFYAVTRISNSRDCILLLGVFWLPAIASTMILFRILSITTALSG